MDAELLGKLAEKVTRAVRNRNTYKVRRGLLTSLPEPKRAFGGINVIMCADFWQLHPVPGTLLASNPQC
eukprot:6951016-Pyramimonas_sp.AAC.1